MRYLFFILIISIFFSCGNSNTQNNEDVYFTDTIKASIDSKLLSKNEKLLELSKKYYTKSGIVISEYYEVWDSLSIDLNFDMRADTIMILTPIPLINTEYYDNSLEPYLNRLLVEVVYEKNKANIRKIHSNLISNIGGVLSKYYGILLTKNGFEIQHESGSRYTWIYSVEISNKHSDSLTLFKIKKECSFEGNQKSEEYIFNDYPLGNINIMDTIYNNCGCNSIWNELERKYSFN